MPEVTAIVTALIVDRPYCLDCLAHRAETPRPAVEATLAKIENVVALRRAAALRCQACGTVGPVVFIERPSN